MFSTVTRLSSNQILKNNFYAEVIYVLSLLDQIMLEISPGALVKKWWEDNQAWNLAKKCNNRWFLDSITGIIWRKILSPGKLGSSLLENPTSCSSTLAEHTQTCWTCLPQKSSWHYVMKKFFRLHFHISSFIGLKNFHFS